MKPRIIRHPDIKDGDQNNHEELRGNSHNASKKQTNKKNHGKELILRNKQMCWIPETKPELLQTNIQKIKKNFWKFRT